LFRINPILPFLENGFRIDLISFISSKMSQEILNHPRFETMPVKDLLKEGFSQRFLDHFLLPMSSAVWSTPNEKIMNFHLRSLIRFFVNHGFLGLDTQHQWKTVQGGSQTYKLKIIEPFKDRIKTNCGVLKVKFVEQKAGRMQIRSNP
jgi:predicted NAD/FAD-binding protein